MSKAPTYHHETVEVNITFAATIRNFGVQPLYQQNMKLRETNNTTESDILLLTVMNNIGKLHPTSDTQGGR